MEVELLPVAGAFVVHCIRHSDARGFFQEVFRQSKGVLPGALWKQVSWSHSVAGALRGIHVSDYYKIVTVTRGAVVDVIVDLRPASPTYLRWCRTELTASSPAQLVVPPHCGHGFLCIKDADFLYLQSGEFSTAKELSIPYLDPTLDIQWPLDRFGSGAGQAKGQLLLSSKDQNSAPLAIQRPQLQGEGPAGRVLVVGAAGQVGSAVIRLLGTHNCIAASRERPQSIVDHQGWIQIDLRTLSDDAEGHQQAHNIIQTVCPSAVVICGAMTAVAGCEQQSKEAMAINAIGPAVMAEEALSAGAHVVYLSSDYVFNGQNGPYCALDTNDLEPLNVYGRSKLEGEQQLAVTVEKILARARDVFEGKKGDSHNRDDHTKVCGKVFVLRTSTVFGPESRDGKNTIYQLCRSLSKAKEFASPSDQWGTPTYSKDIAIAIDILLRHADTLFPKQHYAVLNIAGPESMPRSDLHKRAAKVLGLPQSLVTPWSATTCTQKVSLAAIGNHQQVVHRPMRTGLDVQRTSKLLGGFGWAATAVEDAILDWIESWSWGVKLPCTRLEAKA